MSEENSISIQELEDLENKFNKRNKELNLLVYTNLSGRITQDKESEKSFEWIFDSLKEIFNVSDMEYAFYHQKASLPCPKCGKILEPEVIFTKDCSAYTSTYSCKECNFNHSNEIKI